MRALLFACALLLPGTPAVADTLLAAHTIRSRAVIGPSDVRVVEQTVPGALSDPDEAIGREARFILYAGRPIRPGDIGEPAVIERNQLVTLVYARGGLEIVAEGRALGRAGVGDRVRVMNSTSRTTVSGQVTGAGTVRVGPMARAGTVDE